jgi:hypothetical protein
MLTKQDAYGASICTGCKKVVDGTPPGECHDCGGHYRAATPDDLKCERCGAPESARVFGPVDEDRLCQDCIDESNRNQQ